MRNLADCLCTAWLSAWVSLAVLGPAAQAAGPEHPLRVLVVTSAEPPGKGHDPEARLPILKKLLDKLEGFQLTRLDELAKLNSVKPGEYDVLLFYGGAQKNELQERAVQRFVNEGGGLVALHH